MSLLLDTNILSELRKRAEANARARRWFDGVAPEEIYLSVLAIGELRRGVELVRRRDSRQADALERWLFRVASGSFWSIGPWPSSGAASRPCVRAP